MSTQFDNIAGQVFSQVTKTFGEAALWLSEAGEISGRILFKDPTEPIQIGDQESYEYRPNTTTIEFYEGTFSGLKEAVDNGEAEYIKARGQKYLVESVTTRYDGKTIVAHLEPHEDEEL